MRRLAHNRALSSPMQRAEHLVLDADPGEDGQGFGLNDYLDILRRRKLEFLVPTVILLVVTIVVAYTRPAVYRSSGTILIEQQEIPDELVRSTVNTFAAQRIQTITQRVLTTDRLFEIAEKLNLYPELRKSGDVEVLADRMRANFSVEGEHFRIWRRTPGTVAFSVSYDSRDPAEAQAVASELTSLYLEENIRRRTESAADTTRFLEEESRRLGDEIDELEGRIAEFKQVNMGRLPEQLSTNLQAMERTEGHLQEVARQIETLEDRKVYIEAAMKQIQASNDGYSSTSPLEGLRVKLQELLINYTDAHPDVIRLRKEIEIQEQRLVAAESRPGNGDAAPGGREALPGSGSTNADIVDLETDLRSADSEIRTLKAEQVRLRDKLTVQEDLVAQIPQIEREYSLLIRDRETLLGKYREVKNKLSNARIAEELELERKGERFTLIEPPRYPSAPFEPNRKKIVAMGLFGSLMAGAGTIVLSEFLQRAVHGPRGVTALLGAPPLAVIPYIQNAQDRRRRGLRRHAVLALLLGLAAIAAAYVHFGIMPLDELFPILYEKAEALWARLSAGFSES